MIEKLELRGYRPELVERGAANLREALKRSEDPLLPLPGGFVMRDAERNYWAYGPRGQAWYRVSEAGWQANEEPPARLEGLGAFGVWTRREQASAPAELPGEGEYEDPVSGIEALVGQLREVYYNGELSHWQVEVFLEQLALTDEENEVWVPGFRKERWYRWDGTRWAPQEKRPIVANGAASTPWAYCGQCGAELREGLRFCVSCGAPVGDRKAPEASYRAIAAEIEAGPGWIPEPFLESWAPPDSFPEVLHCPSCDVLHLEAGQRCSVCAAGLPLRPGGTGPLQCSNCGSDLRAGVKFCTECGTRAGGA